MPGPGGHHGGGPGGGHGGFGGGPGRGHGGFGGPGGPGGPGGHHRGHPGPGPGPRPPMGGWHMRRRPYRGGCCGCLLPVMGLAVMLTVGILFLLF